MKITVVLSDSEGVSRQVQIEDPTIKFSERTLRSALKVVDEVFIVHPGDEVEVHATRSLTERVVGFQPNPTEEEDDDAEGE